MNHRQFISTLRPEALSRLTETANGPGLRHLAGHLGLIAGLGTWIAQGWPLWQAMVLPQGIVLCFLFTLQHEATHRTPFATPWLNEWVGRLAGLPIFQPFEWFRYFHLAHHRHTNIPGKDPELIAGQKPETWAEYIRHVSGLPFWAAMIRQTLANAAGRDPGPFIPERARPRVRAEARVMLALYALALCTLAVTPLLVWVWLLPVLVGQPVLRLYLLAEHGRCPFVADMLENSRTTVTNRVVRFLAWNMPYHAEHHTLPNVPFHRLPDVHALMAGRHRVTANGYAAFTRDYARHLR